jgi:periplasmic protein TonB
LGPIGDGEGVKIPGHSGVSFPVCAYCPRPDYSDEARRAKYQGTVILSLIVLPDGHASSVEVVNSPGLGLDTKAVEAVQTWRFTPARDPSGKPVAARINVEVVFQLF